MKIIFELTMLKIIDKLISSSYFLFYSNKHFTDSALTNFGKSLENLLTLNSIFINFTW